MNPNDYILKSITINTKMFSDFLAMSNEDAGEFIKYLLQYAMDGTRPKMSNAWKQNMYSIYERTITEQMSTLDEKRKKAVLKAREREREKKEALKLLKAEKTKGKGTSADNTFVEADSPDVEVVEPENIKHDDRSIFAPNPQKVFESFDDKRHDGNSIHHHFKFGFHDCSFELKRIIESLLRSEIKQAITEEKRDADTDYLELLNKTFDFESAFNVAAMLFVGYVDAATSMSESIGGGGSSCTSGWGKKDDDEEEWARKCARQAVKMCKPQMVKHAIAKPKYRRR